MTRALFREDAYQKTGNAVVAGHSPEGGIILDQTVFYPTGGGQPGDSGALIWDGQSIPIATTIKGSGDDIILVPGDIVGLPPIGATVDQVLDWDRRLAHMKAHTALHLLSVAIPLPVSGGSISVGKGRLDFDMPSADIDKDALNASLNQMIENDLPVIEGWISDAELRAKPELVKTMSVMPPMGQGRIRLISIGDGSEQIDLQPCGGTHVARTSEIGHVAIGKVQKKGKQNRRVYLMLDL